MKILQEQVHYKSKKKIGSAVVCHHGFRLIRTAYSLQGQQ